MSRLTFRDLQHATIVAKLQARRAKAERADPVPDQPAGPATPEPNMLDLIHQAIHKEHE